MKNIILTLLCFLPVVSVAGDFNVINGIEIKDRRIDIPVDMGLYIEPNELNPNVYADVLRDRTGVLISVGTIRALIAFSLGNFSRLVMLDNDQRILDFNRKLLSCIKKITELFPDNPSAQREHYNNYSYYQNLFAPSEIPYFWESDDMWLKIANALREGRISVIKGDLEDSQYNRPIIKALNKGLTDYPRTVDISNVPFYIKNKSKLGEVLDDFLSPDSGQDQDIALITTYFNKLHDKALVVTPTFIKGREDGLDWHYYWAKLGEASEYYWELGSDWEWFE